MKRYVKKVRVRTHIGGQDLINEVEMSVMAESLDEARDFFFRMEKSAYVATSPIDTILCECA